ncbi:MAG: hypothetical protein KIT87_05295 [Anaerolineae bacterium]|nr:hypothetical protein [Anaerolineae bacterium]
MTQPFPTEVRLAAYGVHVAVRLLPGLDATDLHPYLPPGWRASTRATFHGCYALAAAPPTVPAPDRYVLYGPGGEVARAATPDVLLRVLESDLRLFIAERAAGRVFVHAGVVGWGGHAVVMPGRSYAGKTTLVAALVQAGAVYFSDEYAVLDRHGLVHPYPKPLSVRDTVTGEQREVTVEALGGQAGSGPLKMGLALVGGFAQDAVWAPTPMTAGEVLLALADNAIAIRRAPRRVLAALTRAVAGAEGWQGTRGEAGPVVEAVRAWSQRVSS